MPSLCVRGASLLHPELASPEKESGGRGSAQPHALICMLLCCCFKASKAPFLSDPAQSP